MMSDEQMNFVRAGIRIIGPEAAGYAAVILYLSRTSAGAAQAQLLNFKVESEFDFDDRARAYKLIVREGRNNSSYTDNGALFRDKCDSALYNMPQASTIEKACAAIQRFREKQRE